MPRFFEVVFIASPFFFLSVRKRKKGVPKAGDKVKSK